MGLSLILLLISFVGGGEIAAQLKRIDFYWGLAAACCIFASTLLGGFNLLLLVRSGSTGLSASRFFTGYWFAWGFGLVVPGGVGDIVAISAWLKRQGLEWHAGIGASLLDKLISLFWLLAFALSGISYIEISADILSQSRVVGITAGVTIIALAFIYLMVRKGRISANLFTRTLVTVTETVRSQPGAVAFNALLTPLKVSILCLSYWCMFTALGADSVEPWRVITLAAAAGLVGYIPISFNGLGTVEAAGIFLFGSLSLPPDIILSAYLLLRLLVMVLAWGPIGIWWLLSRT